MWNEVFRFDAFDDFWQMCRYTWFIILSPCTRKGRYVLHPQVSHTVQRLGFVSCVWQGFSIPSYQILIGCFVFGSWMFMRFSQLWFFQSYSISRQLLMNASLSLTLPGYTPKLLLCNQRFPRYSQVPNLGSMMWYVSDTLSGGYQRQILWFYYCIWYPPWN